MAKINAVNKRSRSKGKKDNFPLKAINDPFRGLASIDAVANYTGNMSGRTKIRPRKTPPRDSNADSIVP